MGTEGEAKIRLTRSVRQRLLAQNEGFTDRTYYEGKNFREQRDYEIRDGELHIRSRGKTSWADSRFDDQFVADDEQTRRFLRNNLHALNTDGLDRPVEPPIRAEPDEHTDSTDNPSSDYVGEEPFFTDFDDDDDDEYAIDPRVAGALIAVIVALKLAPHAKRWWSESRAKRKRRRSQGG